MNTTTILIRQAHSADINAIRNCAHAAYQPYIARMNQKPAPMIADFASQVSQGVVHVGSKNDKLLGFVVYYPVEDHIHLENVAVHPVYKGMGIGKQLIQHVEACARAMGITTVELYTNEMMHENIDMYPKLGYVETERKKQSGFNRVFFRKIVQ